MSGHSKWASIKHQKGVADARRGQLFTKLTREIIVAVKQGGSSPETNFRLRLAIQKARDANMPLDNIQRAIKRGAGETEGATYTEITYEGYGPGGAAIIVQALTDNKNRTLQEVRNLFSRSGGNLGEPGSVAWQFQSKGLITISSGDSDPEELALQVIDFGADDIKVEGENVEIYTSPEDFVSVREALEEAGFTAESSEVSMIPQNTVDLEDKPALQNLKLLQKLEELDDIQSVSSNINFTDEILEQYEG